MFDRSRRDSRGPDPDILRSPAPGPGKSTLTAGLAPAGATGPVQLSPAGPPAPVTEQAKVAGPNKNTTINWDDPPALYGIAGGGKTSLRTLYRQHVREHMALEPKLIQLGTQALLPGEVGARIEAIADGSNPLWLGGTQVTGPDAAVPYREALWRCSQRAIVDTLATTASDTRYKKDKVPLMKGGKPVLDENGQPRLVEQTYCNVYGPDMVNAMGGYIPRVWYSSDALDSPTKKPADQLTGKMELSANQIGAWLAKWGSDFGWRPTADAEAAQAAANAGRVVIIQASKIDGSSGHVNVVLAEGAGHHHTTGAAGGFQPLQSQAGVHNYEYSDTAAETNSDSWWASKEMKQNPGGQFWIYGGAAQATAVATATEMGGKFG
jgi:hypothetical protein